MKLLSVLAIVAIVAIALIWKINVFDRVEPAGIVWCRGCDWPPR
jgi:hypothetical protein